MSNVSLRRADHPWKERGPGHVIHFRILHPLNFSGMAEDRIVKFCARVGPRSISLVMTNCPQVGVVKVMWRLNFLAKLVLISWKRCKTKIHLRWKSNRKSYMTYQMAATAVTLNGLKGHSPVAGFQTQSVEHLCSILHDFNWQCARGPSALAELLVWIERLEARE